MATATGASSAAASVQDDCEDSGSRTAVVIVEAELNEEMIEELEEDRQSQMSGISQQDRDNKTILLRQAASGKASNFAFH